VIADRTAWVRSMLISIRSLPLESREAFRSDPRNVAAAESYLRRALEALLDLGRHILAKGFGEGVGEYKEIARALEKQGVLQEQQAAVLRELAGYRNRMVHFYLEISSEELQEICGNRLADIENLLDSLTHWVVQHPEMVDREL